MVSDEEFLYFVDRALDGMAAILADLGDGLANERPALPGANSPYAIVNHCLGVVEYWAGHLVAGRPVDRDRPAEFTASGPVHDLTDRIEATKAQLRRDVAAAVPADPLRAVPPPDYLTTEPDLTQGAALLHVFEELAQHHGQLEISRDVLRQWESGTLAPPPAAGTGRAGLADAMDDDPQPVPAEELVGKDELDEDDEMELAADDLVADRRDSEM